MVQLGVPMPVLAAAVAIFMELPVAFAVAVGAFTRPSALLLALYTLGTALIGHRYWTVTGADQVDSMDGFYKDLSIMGGFLLLYITGAGKYSIDALLASPRHDLCAVGPTMQCHVAYFRCRTCDRRSHQQPSQPDRQPSQRSVTSSSTVKRLA